MKEKHKKDDDEIAIDFSKIKNWFTSKKTTEEHNKKEQHTHKSAEHTHHKEEQKEDDEEIKIDYKNAAHILKKYSTALLLLIPIILTIYLRVQPMYLPATDSWAENSVYNYYKSQIETQIDQQYPNLPDTNKQALIQTEFAKFQKENKAVIDQQVEATSQQFKEKMMYTSGNSAYVYLGDIDSYYWLRDARKFIQNGTMCDELNSQACYIDTYTQAPLKSTATLEMNNIANNGKFYAYVIAYVYKIGQLFSKDMTIMQAALYVPVLFGLICAILSFFIGKLIAGNFAGLVTSIFISVNPIHLSRTMGSDNDPINIFFPLIIILFFVLSIQSETLKKKLIYGGLTGLTISGFALSWQGWWFMFNFIIASLVIYLGFCAIKYYFMHKNTIKAINNKETKNTLVILAIIFLSTLIIISAISGFDKFTTFATGPLWFSQTKEASLENYWPNVLVTVAEFNAASIPTIIGQMGGKLIFFLGLIGMLFIMLDKEKITKNQKYIFLFGIATYLFLCSDYATIMNTKLYMALISIPVIAMLIERMITKDEQISDIKIAILLMIWFIATTYAALKGIRFTLLMVSAFGVAIGITLSYLQSIISRWITKELKINEIATKIVVAIILLLVLAAPIRAGNYMAKNYIPTVNDAWYDTLTKIKENSQPDAIINSWWDFGHWFKYIADRRVTLDGSSQGGPPLHWLGKLMVTSDEKHSAGILRMLDCGSNTAFDTLNNITQDTSRSISILDEIVRLDKDNAEKSLLNQGIKKKDAANILKYTHCEAPENFFITSEDMVGKAGVWAHFGSWDFTRAELFIKVSGKTQKEAKKILMSPEYNLTEEEAEQYYYEIQTANPDQWISPWPSYMSSITPCEKPEDNGAMICRQQISNGQQIPLMINLTNMQVIIPATDKNYRPKSIVYVTSEGTEEKIFQENELEFSIVLIPLGQEGYASLITHPYLANSIFTRLFYLGGHGLKYFDKFDDQQGITGGRIIVWKIDWKGESTNTVYKPIETSKTEEEQNTTPAENLSEEDEE